MYTRMSKLPLPRRHFSEEKGLQKYTNRQHTVLNVGMTVAVTSVLRNLTL